MAKIQTIPTGASVDAFLSGVADESRRRDSLTLVRIMKDATGEEPQMWGPSIVGFGSYHYIYASGREGDSPLIGFSPRKQALTLYIMVGSHRYQELMDKLGKHKTGKACLYIKRLSDVNLEVLIELVAESVEYMRRRHG